MVFKQILRNYFILQNYRNVMKGSQFIIFVLPLLLVGLPTVFAQSNNASTTNSTGGLSSESVVAGITNSTASPANLIVNSSSAGEDAQNSTGGLSSESVTESKY